MPRVTVASMRCPTLERLTAIVQGSEPSEPALDAHLSVCATCNAVVARHAALQLGTTFTAESVSLGGASVEPTLGDPSARYEILSVVSRGGLGIVLRARDRQLGRVVALKQMLVRDARLAARFSREALLTARLQHPSIVPLYEAGRAANGEPFYVMKLVAGKTFAERIGEAVDFPSRLALLPNVLAVADAIAYAHAEGIIHRDLKPNNVLIGDFGETVVVDWGLGKRLDGDDPTDAVDPTLAMTSSPGGFTIDGTILGTPRYMAPEQAAGAIADERADVYAIGAMIYTLLSQLAPFAELDPKAAVAAARDRDPTPVEVLEPKTPPDLAALVRTAMAIDPAARYPTARELRDELRRFLDGQLLKAHDYSTWQRVRRFVGAHRAAVLSSVLLFLGLGITGAVSVNRIARERRDAESARRDAEARRDQLALAQARGALATDPTTTLAWLKTYPPTRDWRSARRIADDALASSPARHVFRGARAARLSHRGDQVAIVRGRAVEICAVSSGECRVLSRDEPELNDVAFSPNDEMLVAAGGEPSVVRRWDVASGVATTLTSLGASERAGVLYFSPDGNELVVFNHSRAAIWSSSSASARTLDAKQNGPLYSGAFSPDGKRFAVTNQAQHGVRVWDVARRDSLVVGEHAPTGATPIFASEGRRLLIALETTQSIEEWDLEQRVVLRRLVGSKEDILQLAASADRRLLLSGDNFGQVRLWQLESATSQLLGELRGSIMAADLSADGTWAAAASIDGVIALWHLPTGDRTELRGHGETVEQLQFAADGKRLLSRGNDRAARVWDLPHPRRIVVAMGGLTHASAAFSPDGAHVAFARGDGVVQVCDTHGSACKPLSPPVAKPQWVEYAADGRLFVSGKSGRIWDPSLATSKELWRDQVMLATFSPDGRYVVAPGAASPALYLFDGLTGARVATYPCGVHVQAGFVAANGARVAWGDERGMVRWADLPSGVPHELTIGADLQVPNVALSRDGKILVASGEDGGVRLWNLPNETPQLLGKHTSPSQPIAIAPDGRTVASGGWDQIVRIFSLATGSELVGRGHQGPVIYLQFSPDGKVIATGSQDGGVGMWSAETGAGRVVAAHTPRSVRGVSFSSDGRRLVSTGEDGTLQIWEVAVPDDNLAPTSVLARISSVTSVVLDAEDRPATRVSFP